MAPHIYPLSYYKLVLYRVLYNNVVCNFYFVFLFLSISSCLKLIIASKSVIKGYLISCNVVAQVVHVCLVMWFGTFFILWKNYLWIYLPRYHPGLGNYFVSKMYVWCLLRLSEFVPICSLLEYFLYLRT